MILKLYKIFVKISIIIRTILDSWESNTKKINANFCLPKHSEKNWLRY